MVMVCPSDMIGANVHLLIWVRVQLVAMTAWVLLEFIHAINVCGDTDSTCYNIAWRHDQVFLE
jgi:hypothetical protein